MDIDPRIKDNFTDQLFAAILTLETVDECYRFFEDLCTIGEIKSMAQRFEVARMIKEGNTYDKIMEGTGASTATISRIKRFFNYGADGYRIALDRMEEQALKEKDTQ